MPPLHESVRPATLDGVLAQDKAIAKIKLLEKRGLGGRALWLQGKSGTGKTTIARIVARMVAHEDNVQEINARDVDITWCQEFERSQTQKRFAPAGAPEGTAFILNEAHLMRSAIVSRLLTTLEALAPHVVVIFTTTCENAAKWEDASLDTAPFLSRCVMLELSQRDLKKSFAEHLQRVAIREGLASAEVPMAKYEKLLETTRNNLRAALQAIEAGEML